MFTRLYLFEYELNNMVLLMLYYENSTCGVIISWSDGVIILLVVGGSDRVTQKGPMVCHGSYSQSCTRVICRRVGSSERQRATCQHRTRVHFHRTHLRHLILPNSDTTYYSPQCLSVSIVVTAVFASVVFTDSHIAALLEIYD